MIDNVQIEELYKQMAQSIIDGESEQAVELAQKSLEFNMHPTANRSGDIHQCIQRKTRHTSA